MGQVIDIEKPLYTTADVMRLLKCSKHAVNNHCARKTLRFIKLGKERRFPHDWLQEDVQALAG